LLVYSTLPCITDDLSSGFDLFVGLKLLVMVFYIGLRQITVIGDQLSITRPVGDADEGSRPTQIFFFHTGV
jgi:Tfp pilus assembly protein PilX